jgi:hypothetical protein
MLPAMGLMKCRTWRGFILLWGAYLGAAAGLFYLILRS